ncbi:hypothetical protein [Nocardia sp. NPDC057668]|uniref:hypothetical protein n=1 Tax=Nocardia sp. NPDC057668 TaxID=3346202 RepID=UPI00366ACE9F
MSTPSLLHRAGNLLPSAQMLARATESESHTFPPAKSHSPIVGSFHNVGNAGEKRGVPTMREQFDIDTDELRRRAAQHATSALETRAWARPPTWIDTFIADNGVITAQFLNDIADPFYRTERVAIAERVACTDEDTADLLTQTARVLEALDADSMAQIRAAATAWTDARRTDSAATDPAGPSSR